MREGDKNRIIISRFQGFYYPQLYKILDGLSVLLLLLWTTKLATYFLALLIRLHIDCDQKAISLESQLNMKIYPIHLMFILEAYLLLI